MNMSETAGPPPLGPDVTPPPGSASPSPETSPTEGYLSEEGKSLFVALAWALAGVCFLAQWVLPDLVAKQLTPHGLLGGVELTAHQVNNAAFWDGRVWYVQKAGSLDGEARTRLLSLVPGGEAESQEVAALDAAEPWLVAGQDRLWIVSTRRVAWYKDGRVESVRNREWLANVTRPFLYEGKLGIVRQNWPEHSLQVFEDRQWREALSFRLVVPEAGDMAGEDLQIVPDKGRLHVFYQRPGTTTVSYGVYRPGEGGGGIEVWEEVTPKAGGQWKGAVLGGRPVVVYHDSVAGNLSIVGLKRSDAGWEEFLVYGIGLDIGLEICPMGDGGDFILLRRILPLDTEVVGVVGDEPAWRYKQNGVLRVLPKYKIVSAVVRAVPLLLSGLLAVILSLLMRRYRASEYVCGRAVVRFASLPRRAAAAAIDTVLVVGPFVALVAARILELMDQPFSLFAMLDAIRGVRRLGLLWFPGMLLLFSYLEGKFGRTPGKWACGLRVVDTEVRPCGFARGLARNIVRIVDVLGWYIVGMLSAAVTAKQQRVGDMAAGTIVIRTPGAQSAASQFPGRYEQEDRTARES